MSIIKHGELNVVVIKVPTVTGTPVSVRGRYFRRVGRTNQRMSHEEIMQRIVASTGLSWDTAIETTATLTDLNIDKINNYIQIIKKKGRLPIPEQASEWEILKKLELIKDQKPTRAALLLFCNNPETYFSSAFLKIGRFRSPTLIVDDREIHGTLIDQLDGALGWFRERLETEFIITGESAREVLWEYPLEAIREAVTNVLCHRDYTSLAHSQIRLYDDHLEFWNSGSLPSALTPEALLLEHDSMPRNRKIAESFFYAGFIERWGSGTLRMAEELEIANLPPPEFKSESGLFRLIFYKQFLSKNYLKKIGLSERQFKAATYAKDHGSISNSEYQQIAEVSKRTATRELNDLKEKGIFILEGTTGKGTIYRLKGS